MLPLYVGGVLTPLLLKPKTTANRYGEILLKRQDEELHVCIYCYGVGGHHSQECMLPDA